MLNLDTHILIHALAGDLKRQERTLLATHQWSISAIVLWEVAKLVQLGRIDLDIDAPEFSRLLTRVHIWPLTLEICRRIRSLDIRSDPADEIIAATSVVHNVPLLTRDRVIRKSRLIPLCLT
jgi:PIN domain nuclease of toxin-antitoxin system